MLIQKNKITRTELERNTSTTSIRFYTHQKVHSNFSRQ